MGEDIPTEAVMETPCFTNEVCKRDYRGKPCQESNFRDCCIAQHCEDRGMNWNKVWWKCAEHHSVTVKIDVIVKGLKQWFGPHYKGECAPKKVAWTKYYDNDQCKEKLPHKDDG